MVQHRQLETNEVQGRRRKEDWTKGHGNVTWEGLRTAAQPTERGESFVEGCRVKLLQVFSGDWSCSFQCSQKNSFSPLFQLHQQVFG